MKEAINDDGDVDDLTQEKADKVSSSSMCLRIPL
jgi:hypothetical protein